MPQKISESFQVDTAGRNPETGDKIEPEQAPAAQVTVVPPIMRMQTPSGMLERPDGSKVPVSQIGNGTLPVLIAQESSAGELAMNVKSKCCDCVYWSHEAWARIKASLERALDASSRAQLDKYREGIRFMLADSPEVFDPNAYENFERDVERHLMSQGVCLALTEMFASVPEELGGRGPHLTFPTGGCPVGMEVPGKGVTVGDLFKPRGAEGERRSSLAYDEVLLLASKRTLT